MKTTVIVPVYNRPDTLPLAVRSLLAHGAAVDLDILIVDDGSTDETPDVIAGLIAEHDGIRSVRRENGGVAAARNTGLAHLLPETEIVTFLDSDDVMAAERFDHDLVTLRDRPEIEITYGDMVVTDRIDPDTLVPPTDAVTRRVTSVHLSCALMRRGLVERIGLFDETLVQAEDTDYILRVFESRTRFVQTTTLSHYYLRHPGNMTKNTDAMTRYFARAVLLSLQRRRADASLVLDKPSFAIELPRELI